MANNTKDKPIGIDRAIYQLQKPLYKRLNALAVANQKTVNGYGRVYLNESEEGKKLEYYLGNKEYKDVLGGEDSRFFFHLHDNINGQQSKKARVDLICLVNLVDLMGDESRKDEEFRAIVTEVIGKVQKFELKDTAIGMKYIESIISKPFQKTNIHYSDMHPRHAVTFQTEVTYELKTCL